MAEYIEREALLKSICNSCDGWCENTACDCVNCKSEHRCDMVVEIAEFSAVDVAPVVRCKDCKNRYDDSWCEYVDDDDNFYCARGERKDGDG